MYRSCQPEDLDNSMCFQILGFDVMIDKKFKPWLIEVNASPSLTASTDIDRTLKMSVIHDTFQIVVPPDWQDENSKHGANTSRETQVGNFSLIIDETTAEPSTKGNRTDKQIRKGATALWR